MTERQTGKEHKRTHTQTIKQKQPKSYVQLFKTVPD